MADDGTVYTGGEDYGRRWRDYDDGCHDFSLFSPNIMFKKEKKRKREKLWGLDFSPSSVLQFSKIHRFASHSPPLLYVTNGRAISRSLGKMRVAVVQQFYETRVIDEFVLRGNTATLKCLVPSFVADFVDVIEWLAVEDGSTYSANSQEEKGTPSLSLSSRLLEKIFSETAMST